MPAVTLYPRILDFGLNVLDSETDRLLVCSSPPTDYASATAAALGYKSAAAGSLFGSPADYASGRKIASNVITDGTITTTGTPVCWAAVDAANSRLHAVGGLTASGPVNAGLSFTLASFTIDMPGLFVSPNWWLPNAYDDLWFASAKYYSSLNNPVTNYLSCSRTSIGYAKTSTGTLQQFAANQLRITDSGLLVEDARTNLVLYSQSFSNWYLLWGLSTALDNQTTAPDGTATASKLTEDSANADHDAHYWTTCNATVHSFTCYLKQGTRRYAALTLQSQSPTQYGAVFDLQNGTVGDTYSAGSPTNTGNSIEAMGNGWYRCRITKTMETGSNTSRFYVSLSDSATPASWNIRGPIYQGDGSSYIYVWGAQLEEASFPSSYIPTTSAAATRGADAIDCIGASNSILLATSASVVVDAKASAVPTGSGYWRLIGTTPGAQDILVTQGTSDVTQTFENQLAAGLQATGAHSITLGVKSGASYTRGTGRSIVVDGGTVSSDALAVDNGSVTQYTVGYGNAATFYGYFRRITLWNTRLADATLQNYTDPATTLAFPAADAAVDLDFTNGQYYATPLPTQFLSISRASVGYAKTAAGTLTQFGTNTLRITDKGLLVEDSRTNLCLYSQDIEAHWGTDFLSTASSTTATAPDGTATAQTFSPESNGVDGRCSAPSTPAVTSGVPQTVSIYAKRTDGANSWVRLDMAYAGKHLQQWFNLSSGTQGTPSVTAGGYTSPSYGMESLANNWWRVWITGTPGANDFAGVVCGIANADGTISANSADSYTLWGAQQEDGAFPSSYIPTTSSSATRAADSILFTGTAKTLLEALPNSGVFDGTTLTNPGAVADWNIIASAAADDSYMQARDNTQVRSREGGVYDQASITATGGFATGLKAGYGISSSALTLVAGDDASPATFSGSPFALTNPRFLIGGNVGSWYGYARRLTLWNSKLADATLQALTAP